VRSASLGILAASAILLLVSGRAGAGESPQDKAAKGRANAFVARCKACDESLLGTSWIGMYARGWRLVGTMRMDVRKGTDGAAYDVALETRMAGQGRPGSQLEELKLDPSFALLYRKKTGEQDGRKNSMTLQLKKDLWECVWEFQGGEADGKPVRFEQKATEKDHGWAPAQFLLLRKLDLKKPADYLFRGTTWPVPAEKAGEEPRGTAGYRNVRITVPARDKYTHRGAAVPGFTVRIEKEGDPALKVVVDESGRLLRIGDFREGVTFVAGTEQEASHSLPCGTEKPGEEGPRAALRLYFLVITKGEDVDTLDEVVDWPSAYEEAAKSDQRAAGIGAEAFALLIKADFMNAEAPFDSSQAEQIAGRFTVEIKGENATMSVAGLQWKPVQLKRIDGKWKLAALPR
jgi:hypothetical protein